MAVTTSLAACNVNPALNGPDGSDLLSVADDAIRNALSFIAQLRDGVAAGGGLLWMTGLIAQFATTATPTGWLKLNGQLVSRTTYANLFAFASASGILVAEAAWAANSWGCFGVGDGASTFRLPDMRGMHPRGADESRGMDIVRNIGSYQDQAVLTHTHGVTDPNHTHTGGTNGAGGHSHSVNDPTHSHQILNDVTNTFGSGAGLSGVGNVGAGSASTQAAATGISLVAVADHAHTLSVNPAATGISIQATGGTQNLVRNVAWPFFIKY